MAVKKRCYCFSSGPGSTPFPSIIAIRFLIRAARSVFSLAAQNSDSFQNAASKQGKLPVLLNRSSAP